MTWAEESDDLAQAVGDKLGMTWHGIGQSRFYGCDLGAFVRESDQLTATSFQHLACPPFIHSLLNVTLAIAGRPRPTHFLVGHSAPSSPEVRLAEAETAAVHKHLDVVYVADFNAVAEDDAPDITGIDPAKAASKLDKRPATTLAAAGFHDVGQLRGDSTPTVGHGPDPLAYRCDRILTTLPSEWITRYGVERSGDVDWLKKTKPMVHIRRQVKVMKDKLGKWRLVFALPKGGKTGHVPLPAKVKAVLSEHARLPPPVEVTLPWGTPDGEPTTVRLFFTSVRGNALQRGWFNQKVWRPALVKAGIVKPSSDDGDTGGRKRSPALSKSAPRNRDDNGMHALRHRFASVLLAGGEGISAVAEWMRHSSSKITLDRYGHLLPEREDRMASIIDATYEVDHEQGAPQVHSQDRQ